VSPQRPGVPAAPRTVYEPSEWCGPKRNCKASQGPVARGHVLSVSPPAPRETVRSHGTTDVRPFAREVARPRPGEQARFAGGPRERPRAGHWRRPSGALAFPIVLEIRGFPGRPWDTTVGSSGEPTRSLRVRRAARSILAAETHGQPEPPAAEGAQAVVPLRATSRPHLTPLSRRRRITSTAVGAPRGALGGIREAPLRPKRLPPPDSAARVFESPTPPRFRFFSPPPSLILSRSESRSRGSVRAGRAGTRRFLHHPHSRVYREPARLRGYSPPPARTAFVYDMSGPACGLCRGGAHQERASAVQSQPRPGEMRPPFSVDLKHHPVSPRFCPPRTPAPVGGPGARLVRPRPGLGGGHVARSQRRKLFSQLGSLSAGIPSARF